MTTTHRFLDYRSWYKNPKPSEIFTLIYFYLRHTGKKNYISKHHTFKDLI